MSADVHDSLIGRVTGDAYTDAMLPVAARQVAAVRDYDRELITELIRTTGDLSALLITTAAMVPDDYSTAELLGWLANPDEYARLRTAGVDSLTASALVSRKETAA